MSVTEYALANIARVDIETEGDTPTTYKLVDMATEATLKAYVSEGDEKVLRVKNIIKAINRMEDITLGYDIELSSVTLQPEVLALVDGGTWESTTKKYTASVVGTTVSRTPITVKIYTEEKDIDGSTIGYIQFEFKHCKGSPVDYVVKDGEFYAEELKLKSRPKSTESPVEFSYISTLPA